MKHWKIMRIKISTITMLVAGMLPAGAHGAATKPEAAPQDASSTMRVSGALTPESVVREINDPHSGARWLLVLDPSHPAGPGRLVLAEGFADGKDLRTTVALPIIHTGDRLTVEEHTPALDAKLEGVAMGPARDGASFQVRLKLNGTIVHAIALAPGRASLAPWTETQP